MNVDFYKLNYRFTSKPLIIGGFAMEYYGLRKAGNDIDLVLTEHDHFNLRKLYSNHVRDIFGDIGVCVHGFEMWNRILMFPYAFISYNAIEEENVCVVSLDRLLFMKSLAIESAPKFAADVKLIVKKIHAIQYGEDLQYRRIC